MLASFFNTSQEWFAYIANFFFAATFFSVVGRIIYKLITKHYDTKIEEILAQYRPNGGSSAKDQMNRIERSVDDLKVGQDTLNMRLDTITQEFAEHKGYHKGLIDGEI